MITTIMENNDAYLIYVPGSCWGRPSVCLKLAAEETLGPIPWGAPDPCLGLTDIGRVTRLPEASTLPDPAWDDGGIATA